MNEKIITAIIVILTCIGIFTQDVYALASVLMVGIPFITLEGLKRGLFD